MPTVLAAQPGSVKVLNDAAVQATIPALIAFDSPQLTFDSELSIINSIGISEATNHQFMHSLGSDIYIYTFGDRMGRSGGTNSIRFVRLDPETRARYGI